jgi:DNA-binding XRE family transcriptional regulator
MKDFREKIKNKRLLLGLSRDRLAMMSGVTPKTIHTIEE